MCPECGAARAKKKSRLLRAIVYLFLLLIVSAVAASAAAIWTPHLDSTMAAIEKSEPKIALGKWRDVARNFVAEKGWLPDDLVPGEKKSGKAGRTDNEAGTGESTAPVTEPPGATPPATEPDKKTPAGEPKKTEPKKTEPEEGPVG